MIGCANENMNSEDSEKCINETKMIRSRSKFKQLEDYYDDHVDELLPETHHRGDIVSVSRMLAYSDAIMATCATFLVLPLKNLKLKEDAQSLSDFIFSVHTEFIMFFLGFLIVLTIWENINMRAIVIKRADDFLLTLVIFEMLGTTFLPFSLALQGHYPYEKISILTTCVILGVLQIIDIVIVLYATHSPKLLHVDLKIWPKSDLQELLLIMIFRPLLSIILLIIAGAFCFVHYGVSWAFISLLTLMPIFYKFYWFISRRLNKFKETEKDSFLLHLSKGNLLKERVQIMSDAAVAIVACILILDITVEEFPEKSVVAKEGLNSVLKRMEPDFLTFLASFFLVSALWYINHTVFHLIKTVNVIMLYFQKIFLAFCCLCPLAANMVLKFASNGNHDSNIAVRFSAMIVFCSSIANSFILLYGLLTGSKYFYQWASFAYFKANKRQHLYTLTKVLNIPFWSLVCTFGSLGSSKAAPYVLYVTFFMSICSFYVSKFTLMNHVGKTVPHLKYSFPIVRKKVTEYESLKIVDKKCVSP
ncbi:endosomal/lysosomal proton channel TMEM175-like isoform X2 [Hydra vulgaris]|uniref:Endosomal/lysosomal proton channel TMEM175 n=1 Tax=Hydra vulgaris TaxID=6087 RepID=A0ABM4DB21_HYDVU